MHPTGQVIHASKVGSGVSSNLSPDAFNYDDCGNLIKKGNKTFETNGWQLSKMLNEDGSIDRSFEYSVDGHLTSKLDAAGRTVKSMKYDTQGRLLDVDGTSFVYDYTGQLLKVTLKNGDVTYYPNSAYEAAIPTGSSVLTHTAYLIANGRHASCTTEDQNMDSAVYYYHTDHLGSVIAVSGGDGSIDTTYSYDTFGKATVQGPDVSRYKYSDKEMFEGLYYFGARFYDPDVCFVFTSFGPSG